METIYGIPPEWPTGFLVGEYRDFMDNSLIPGVVELYVNRRVATSDGVVIPEGFYARYPLKTEGEKSFVIRVPSTDRFFGEQWHWTVAVKPHGKVHEIYFGVLVPEDTTVSMHNLLPQLSDEEKEQLVFDLGPFVRVQGDKIYDGDGNIIPINMGPKGDTGEIGPQGPKGDTGAQGPIGETGPQGPIGLTGPQGPKGDTGPQGLKGNTGAQGPIGLTGPQGLKGDTGPQGPIGETGDQGPIGETGPQGPKGDIGPQGPKGDTGAKGPIGLTGPQGLKGDTGPQGPIGETGPKGDKGDTGAQGLKGDTGAQGIPGPKGDTGLQGPTGEVGPPGLTGPKGDKGDTGPQGIQGLKGDTGATGATGETGPRGLQGIQGPTGPKGDKGDTGSPGAKGDIGLTGPKGDTGLQGPTGPKGDKGDTGPQGLKGDKGDTGATGATGPVGPAGPTDWDLITNKPALVSVTDYDYTVSRVAMLEGDMIWVKSNYGTQIDTLNNSDYLQNNRMTSIENNYVPWSTLRRAITLGPEGDLEPGYRLMRTRPNYGAEAYLYLAGNNNTTELGFQLKDSGVAQATLRLTKTALTLQDNVGSNHKTFATTADLSPIADKQTDTGWVGITSKGVGWSGSLQYRVVRGITYLRGRATRSGGNITGTLETVCTIPTAVAPTSMMYYGIQDRVGRSYACAIGPDGKVQVTNGPYSSISVSTEVELSTITPFPNT